MEEDFEKRHDKSGVIYMSRIPPHMQPHKVRILLEKYGEIGRIYLAREDESSRRKRIKMGGTRRRQFTEGWIEFKDKQVAKTVAATLNAQPMGGPKSSFYHEDLWNLKYLPRFKWINLKEQIAYERISRQKKMQMEMDQAKREIGSYLENVDKAKMIDAIEAKKRARNTNEDGSIDNSNDDSALPKVSRRQRKPMDITESATKSTKVAKVLSKLFD